MEKFDLVVIGAGPSGYAAAMRALDHVTLGFLSPDDTELDEGLRQLVAHRDEIFTWLESTGWLADNTVTFAANAATFTSTMSASNSSAFQVGLMVFSVGLLTLSRPADAPEMSAPAMEAHPPY